MKLDRSKKYEGLGLTIGYDCPPFWSGIDESGNTVTIDQPIMQAWLDAGHIKPVRETKTVRIPARVSFNPVRWNDSRTMVVAVDSLMPLESLLPDCATSRQVLLEFEVEVDA